MRSSPTQRRPACSGRPWACLPISRSWSQWSGGCSGLETPCMSATEWLLSLTSSRTSRTASSVSSARRLEATAGGSRWGGVAGICALRICWAWLA
eukprot:8352385-Lingulodinium_polyedra.AAC.1